MWNKLLQVFNARAAAGLMSLHKEARSFKMKPGEKPSEYVLRARKISYNMRSLGEQCSEICVCSMILEGLTEEYEVDRHLQTSLCNNDPDVHKLQHVLELTYMRPTNHKVYHHRNFIEIQVAVVVNKEIETSREVQVFLVLIRQRYQKALKVVMVERQGDLPINKKADQS